MPPCSTRSLPPGAASGPTALPIEIARLVDRATAEEQVVLPGDPVPAGSWLSKLVPCALVLALVLASCAAFYGALIVIRYNGRSVVACAAHSPGVQGTPRLPRCEQLL